MTRSGREGNRLREGSGSNARIGGQLYRLNRAGAVDSPAPAGIACALGFFTMGLLALPDDAPLHPVLGLVQRIVVTTWLATVVVLSVQLLREPRRA